MIPVALEALGEARVSGVIADRDGAAIAGASAVLRQTFNGKFEREIPLTLGADGSFTATIANVTTDLRVEAAGYYSRTKTVIVGESEENAIDLGTITFTKLPENKITLEMYKTSAVSAGQEQTRVQLMNANGLTFTVYDQTQGKEIEDFTVQYPYIVIGDGAANGGDTLLITATDANGRMTADAAVVTLDAQRMGSGEIDFVENGSFTLAAQGATATVMIFTAEGKFVRSSAASANYTSDPLPAGEYSVVIIKKTDLLRSAAELSKLAEFGLAAGTDYALKNVSIENGVVTDLGSVAVPALNESKLYYTVADSTLFTAGNTAPTVGKYVVMRCEYKIDDKYSASNEKVTIEFPEGVEFVRNSLSLDGKINSYTVNGNKVEIITNKREGVIRFYAIAIESGKSDVNAYLSFKGGSGNIVQPIGTATVTAEALKISVPEKTGQKTITVTGAAPANSTVTVYDNDTAVGTTKSNMNGSWQLRFDLVKPYTYSYHDIYAKIENDNFSKPLYSDVQSMIYDKNYIELSKVTMINTAHPATSLNTCEFVTEFDFINPSSIVPSYNYWPQYPTFTFKVEFTGGDDTTLSDVYVVTTNSAGNKTYVPVYYDANTGVWLGTYEYTSYSVTPVKVNVTYNNSAISDIRLDEEGFKDYLESTGELLESVSDFLSNEVELKNEVITDDYIKYDVIYEGDLIGEYKIEFLDYFDVNLDFFETHSGYVEFDNDDGKKVYSANEQSDMSFIKYMVDETEQLYVKECLTYINTDANTRGHQKKRGWGNDVADFANFVGGVIPNLVAKATSIVINYGTDIVRYNRLIYSYISIIDSELKNLERLVNSRCSDGNYKLPESKRQEYLDQLKNLQGLRNQFLTGAILYANGYLGTAGILDVALDRVFSSGSEKLAQNVNCEKIYRSYQKINGKSGRGRLSNKAKDELSKWAVRKDVTFQTAGNITQSAVTGASSKILQNLFLTLNVPATLSRAQQNISDLINEQSRKVGLDYRDCDSPEDPPADPPSSDQDMHPIADPSGFVYEAVPSNRIEGVKVEAYVYDYEIDEFGMPAETKSNVLWNAEEYDQVNPLYTDAAGAYAWDVPFGQWFVKFSKEGYYDADSSGLPQNDADGYLPVPPPQTEVNVGMISKAAPTVKSVSAYNNSVRIEFSQYMKLDTVNASTITVKSGGKTISGTVSPLNAEYDYENVNRYASIFEFVPNEKLSGTATITVAGAVNYAGTAMEKSFSESAAVKVKPESIECDDEIGVAYTSGALISVDVLPAQGGAGRTITVSSSSPSIVGIANDTVELDENGHANIMVTGELPGQAQITITLDGTDLSASVTVTVAGVVSVADRCEKVTSSIDTGSVVEAGTKLELATATEGAEIYYTLDGSCPCTVDSTSRIKYTGPISIDEDSFIIAYAVKEGMEDSYTAGFMYTVEKTQEPQPRLGDVNGDGVITARDVVLVMKAALPGFKAPADYHPAAADMDANGEITARDVIAVMKAALAEVTAGK